MRSAPTIAPPPARRSHAERSAATRAQLIEATAELVRSGGFQAASMFEVAKAAGVTPGALQHHFGSKAELMLQVVEHVLLAADQGDGQGGVPLPAPTLALPRRAQAFVQAMWRGVYEPPRFLAAWGIYFGSCGDAALRERIAAQRKRISLRLAQRFVEVFPELAGRPGAAGFVELVLAGLRGLAIQRLFDPSPAASAAARRELARLITSRCQQAIEAQAKAQAHTAPETPRRRPRR